MDVWNEDSVRDLLGEICLEAKSVIFESKNYSEGSKEPLNIFEQWEDMWEARFSKN